MTKITQVSRIYPFGMGLDLTSTPGSQDWKSLTKAKNIILNNRGSLKKKPGVERISYIGNETGNLQAAVHFFATSGGAQRSEVVRAIGGRLEAIRDGQAVDLGISFDPTDVITFERFANVLIINFENTPPYKYQIGGTPQLMGILEGHDVLPPTISRQHQFRLFYVRPPNPHVMYVSAVNDFENYNLIDGGFSMRVTGNEGDPVGITGISPTFRGDLYPMKYNSIHRVYSSPYGFAVDQISDEVGCIAHNTIVQTQNDIIFVSPYAIHSLVNTDTYGSIQEATLSYPIFEAFQEMVNWSASKYMIGVYDKPSNCYMLSYASSGSSENNRVLGFNIKSKQFWEWENVYYPVLAKYFDFGRQSTLIGDQDRGLGVLRKDVTTAFGEAVDVDIATGVIFPITDPKTVVNFTMAWILIRPTYKSVLTDFSYYVNGDLIDTIEVDSYGNGTSYYGEAAGKIGTAVIGESLIGMNKDDMKIIGVELAAEGNSIQFRFEHTPPSDDPDQAFELYGVAFEYSYEEDQESPKAI